MKNIVIIGSTGSIGRTSLEVISMFPERFRVIGLGAGSNANLLLEQIRKFKPRLAAIKDDEAFNVLKSNMVGNNDLKLLKGMEGICRVAEMSEADIVISAISGSAGLMPTISAIRANKTVALANKESLVMAGEIVMSEARKYGTHILPVDSEHSAIFQCLVGAEKDSLKRLILTASGGPFIGRTLKELETVNCEDALKHPKWNMGRKITIDSATLMNKGLEVIEAHHLFNLPPEKIDVLIHPQSIVHSIVEFKDGSYIAQMSLPDMKGPIAYALSFPERLSSVMHPIDWEDLSTLTFFKPDNKTFPSLSLAYQALKIGGTMPAVLNGSNEAAVKAFLDGIIQFNDIPVIIQKVMNSHKVQPADDIDVIIGVDRWAKKATMGEINR